MLVLFFNNLGVVAGIIRGGVRLASTVTGSNPVLPAVFFRRV